MAKRTRKRGCLVPQKAHEGWAVRTAGIETGPFRRYVVAAGALALLSVTAGGCAGPLAPGVRDGTFDRTVYVAEEEQIGTQGVFSGRTIEIRFLADEGAVSAVVSPREMPRGWRSVAKRFEAYIDGRNATGKKIETNRAVIAVPADTKNGMPDWRFHLPITGHHRIDDIPLADDPDLQISGEVRHGIWALVEVRDWQDEKRLAKDIEVLRTWLLANNYEITGHHRVLIGSLPWVTPELRYDAIMLPVRGDFTALNGATFSDLPLEDQLRRRIGIVRSVAQ